uniref:Ranaspumin n=1 Tax=Leptodactylus vastus TaxID=326589 RepID=RANSP_LEPVA|nr:RecName: Full=Ranaspumin; AltName: Full=Lv-RSN-1 [Leptodactylus vastus]4K82_A Chain A, Lv-ranaspumin (Lv-RSN-1) [Leptodactylus vastus]4K83_A Chain A, Lv-ranaspumin (Lv-RSN-1) [Leptodactylus vastus]
LLEGFLVGGGVPGPGTACLTKALKDSGDLLVELAVIICAYQNGKDLQEQDFKELKELLERTLERAGCALDDIVADLGLEELLGSIGVSTGDIIQGLYKLLKELKIDETVFNAVCDVTKKMLDNKCLPKILQGDLVKFLKDLKYKVCIEGGDPELIIKDLKIILERLPCVLGGVGLDDLFKNIFVKDGILSFEGIAKPLGDLLILVLCPNVKNINVSS